MSIKQIEKTYNRYRHYLFDFCKRKSDTRCMNNKEKDRIRTLLKEHTREEKECLVWTGSRRGYKTGYGCLYVGGEVFAAHRVAWTLAFGEIPRGLHILHSCDNPPCVRVEHLRTGTVADNAQDRMKRNPRAHSEGHPRAKLTNADVVAILLLFGSGMFKSKVLALAFNVSQTVITEIGYGRSWTYLPFQQRREKLF